MLTNYSKRSAAVSFPVLFNLRLEYLPSLHVANTPLTLALHCLLMDHKRLGMMDDNSGRLSLLWGCDDGVHVRREEKMWCEWEMSLMLCVDTEGPEHKL